MSNQMILDIKVSLFFEIFQSPKNIINFEICWKPGPQIPVSGQGRMKPDLIPKCNTCFILPRERRATYGKMSS